MVITGLHSFLERVQSEMPFCWGASLGDLESDTSIRSVCAFPERRGFLLYYTDFVALQLREQNRFLMEHGTSDQVEFLHGAISSAQYAVYPLKTDNLYGLFLLLLWERGAGNLALVESRLRTIAPIIALTDDERTQLGNLRREAWESGTSGLLTRLRKMPAQPTEQLARDTSAELLPFEQHDSVMRLLGVSEPANE